MLVFRTVSLRASYSTESKIESYALSFIKDAKANSLSTFESGLIIRHSGHGDKSNDSSYFFGANPLVDDVAPIVAIQNALVKDAVDVKMNSFDDWQELTFNPFDLSDTGSGEIFRKLVDGKTVLDLEEFGVTNVGGCLIVYGRLYVTTREALAFTVNAVSKSLQEIAEKAELGEMYGCTVDQIDYQESSGYDTSKGFPMPFALKWLPLIPQIQST